MTHKSNEPWCLKTEEQICRYSDIHSRKKNRKKTLSTTPFSITYEVAKCCCWISHFFEMPPPLASSRHVAWPRITYFDHVEKSFKFEDFLTLQERSGTSSAHPYGLRFGRIIGTTEIPPLLNRKYIYTFRHILWRLPVCYISILGKHVTYSWWSNSVPNRGNPQSDQTSKILNIDNEYHQTTGGIWTFQTN